LQAHSTTRSSAFTLVELLVVVMIIALLMAILMPALSKARRQAQATQCASNLKQIAAGWRIYVEDYKGIATPARLPLVKGERSLYDIGRGPEYRPRWYQLLGAQTKIYPFREPSVQEDDDRTVDNQLFLCPAVPEWTNPRNFPFGYNFQFLGNAREKAAGKWINFPVNTSSLKSSGTVLAADSMGSAAGHPTHKRRAYRPDGTRETNALGNHSYTIDPPRLTATSDYGTGNHRTPSSRSAPDPRHNGKSNVAFLDGRVELMTLQDLGYTVKPDGAVGIDGNNALFSGSGRDEAPPGLR
jgi:prepilin-type processing-associated H-X9-DG protein/prepilin-type N-terminal cleavage/methylation domain-containing protein